jgi:hypothetical protein
VPEPEARRSIDIRVLKYAAPILLTTLACIQIFFGLNFELTPWKGGGFGMFSTVDTPGSRTVRVYLETDDGDLPTKVPSWLRNRKKYARSFPADFRVRALAVDMAAATWVYREEESSSEQEESSEKDGDAKRADPNPESISGTDKAVVPPERVRPPSDEAADDSAAKTTDKSKAEDSDDDEAYPRVKALKPGDEVEDQEVVAVNAVRVEVWRIWFDVETDVATGERIVQMIEKVPAR